VLRVTKACPNDKQSPGDLFEVLVNGNPTTPATVLDCAGQATLTLNPETAYSITERQRVRAVLRS